MSEVKFKKNSLKVKIMNKDIKPHNLFKHSVF